MCLELDAGTRFDLAGAEVIYMHGSGRMRARPFPLNSTPYQWPYCLFDIEMWKWHVYILFPSPADRCGISWSHVWRQLANDYCLVEWVAVLSSHIVRAYANRIVIRIEKS